MLIDKTIFITGGGSGIGEALAVQLAPYNKVFIAGRNKERLLATASKHFNISYEVMDVADSTSIDAVFSTFKKRRIIFDVLINNAGVAEVWELLNRSFTPVQIVEKINTNFAGPVVITQYFIHQADPQRKNLIINITTEIAIMPVPLLPLYSASKTALSVFTKSLRVQLKNTSFRVIEILPPAIDTSMARGLNNKGNLLSASEFATNMLKNILKGKIEYAPGKNVVVLRFFQKFLSQKGLYLIDKLSRKQLS